MKLLPIAAVSLTVIPGFSALSAQNIAERELPKPNAVMKDALKSVNSILVLTDGRVLVVDSTAEKLQLGDFSSGKFETRMSGGTGDKEFRALGPLWAWTADSVAVTDLLKGQLLIFAPNGTAARTTRFGIPMGGMMVPGQGGQRPPGGLPPAAGGARGGPPGGGGGGRGGRLPTIRYLVDATTAFGSGAPARPATPSTSLQPPKTLFPILRLAMQNLKIDTVAQLMSAQLPRTPQMSTTVGTFSVYVGTAPLQPLDSWTVFRDGTVAVIRSSPYRVDLYAHDGTRTQLDAIPTVAVPVTSGDRKRVVDEYKQMTADVLKSDPRRTAILAVAYEEPQTWPATHPAFRGDVVPLVDAADRIWLMTRCVADEQAVCYDVINRSGERVERFKLPPKTTVVGFGPNMVITAFEQKSDKSLLQRHSLD